jgi:hypothetical protein
MRPDECGTLARAVHERKTSFYAELVCGGVIPLRDG